MARNRFLDIWSNLQLSGNTEMPRAGDKNFDKLYKVHQFLEDFKTNFKLNYHLLTQWSICRWGYDQIQGENITQTIHAYETYQKGHKDVVLGRRYQWLPLWLWHLHWKVTCESIFKMPCPVLLTPENTMEPCCSFVNLRRKKRHIQADCKDNISYLWEYGYSAASNLAAVVLLQLKLFSP